MINDTKIQKVGTMGFWLFVPLGVSFIIGLIVSSMVNWLSMWATTMLVYALFTLWVIGRYKQRVIRISLTLVNLVLFAASGYVQWDFIKPENWPSWSAWVGMVIAGGLWIGLFYIIMTMLGKRTAKETQQGSVSIGNSADESDQLLNEIKSGNITVDVQEKLLAVLKLAGTGGDMTFNAKQVMEQLGLQSEANDRNSRNDAANSIMEAYRMGFYDEADLPILKKAIRELQKVPASETSEADDNGQRGEPEESTPYARIVWK